MALGFAATLAAAVAALGLWPVAPAPAPLLVPVGVREVLPPGFELVEQVLLERAELDEPARHQLALAIAQECERAQLDPLLVLAVIEVESEFQPSAVSPMGARGLMQLTPITLEFVAQREGLSATPERLRSDPSLEVRLGVRYLASLEQRFGSLELGLMAYNMGPGKLIAQAKAKDLERFRNYPRVVLRERQRLAAWAQQRGTEVAWRGSGTAAE